MHVGAVTKSEQGCMDLSGFVNGGGNAIKPHLPSAISAGVGIEGVEKTGRPPVARQEEQAGADAGDRARIVQVNVALVAIVFNPQGITRSPGQ